MSAAHAALAIVSCISALSVGFCWRAPGSFTPRHRWTCAFRISAWAFIACCWLLVVYSPLEPLIVKWLALIAAPAAAGLGAFAAVSAIARAGHKRNASR